jgi:oligosaccharide translocation protein RFT1
MPRSRSQYIHSPMATPTTKQSDDERSQSTQQSILSKSAQGASFLILIQIGSRALTFGVNQILLRFLAPALLGVSTQLEIYQISVLYFARESLRVAVQRQTTGSQSRSDTADSRCTEQESKVPKGYVDADTPGGRTQTVVNISYIPIYLGLPIAVLLGTLYTKSAGTEVASTKWFYESLNLYGVAAFWELLTEPCFVVVQQRLLYKIRALAETTAAVLRCVVTTGVVVGAAREGLDLGVLPFALGQMAYALVLFTVYYGSVWNISKYGGFTLSASPIYSRCVPLMPCSYSIRADYPVAFPPNTSSTSGRSHFYPWVAAFSYNPASSTSSLRGTRSS